MILNLKKRFFSNKLVQKAQGGATHGHIIPIILPDSNVIAETNTPHSQSEHKTDTPSVHNRVIAVIPPEAETISEMNTNNYLAQYANSVASQFGEDGIIQKILEIIGITSPGWCVEFGACDGKLDSNTLSLVKKHGWKAVYIEPLPAFFTLLQQHCSETPGTWCFDDLVGWEGKNRLDAILARTPIPKDFEFMSVDCDGPDYHIWQALEKYRPLVVCIEFNRLINPKVSYFPDKEAPNSRPSSIRALYELGKQKGYELVCQNQWNLFFVRGDHYAKFGIRDNRPEKMFYPEGEMRIFQGYDGTLILYPEGRHFWKCQRNEEGIVEPIKITQRDIQVLPDGLRLFRPRHTYRSLTLEKQAGTLDINKIPKNALLKYRRNVTSENGEDGILEHIFKTLSIAKGFCVDIGACDGKKWSNSWNLIANGNWSGLLIEGDKETYQKLSATHKNNPQADCNHTYVLPHTLESLLNKHGVPQNFDLLTIDVEGNDYHLFAALKNYTPAVVVIDFNPSIANDILFIQENNKDIHYGASLAALAELAKQKKYTLAAVTDWNAIFVRNDLYPKLGITENALDEMYYPPFEMRMFQSLDGCMHLAGCKTLVRQDYTIEWEEFQVLPAQLRGHVNSSPYLDSVYTLRAQDNPESQISFELRGTFY